MDKPRHIAINLPYTPISREIMRGIRDHFEVGPQWTFEIRSGQDGPTRKLFKKECDGVITYGSNRPWHRSLIRTGLPAVVLTSDIRNVDLLPAVSEDNIAIGRIVGEDFLARGFKNIGVVMSAHKSYALDRSRGFTQAVRRSGIDVLEFPGPEEPADEARLAAHALVLAKWVRSMAKPAALFAVNDSQGTQVLNVCRKSGIRVPEDVIVVGVGNDAQVCNLCSPALSSVAIPYVEMGRRAGALLQDLLDDKPVSERTVVIPPLGIVTRRSSETTTGSDPLVVQAARFIADHACDPISVQDVARHVGYSYRRLHERFEQATGRLLHDEIRRVQLNRARLLLTETSTPVHKIAQACGWQNGKQIDRIFKQHEGMTPMAYRERFRTF
jgi:LacI family transcriptional regulator